MKHIKAKIFSKKINAVIQEWSIGELPDSCGENAGKIGISYTELDRFFNPSYLNSNNCELRLFSGLQDSWGQDIYSGDKISVYNNGIGETYTVSFEDGAFWCGEDKVELLRDVNKNCVIV